MFFFFGGGVHLGKTYRAIQGVKTIMVPLETEGSSRAHPTVEPGKNTSILFHSTGWCIVVLIICTEIPPYRTPGSKLFSIRWLGKSKSLSSSERPAPKWEDLSWDYTGTP